MKKLYLKFISTGVANRFDLGDYELIEMNRRIKNYPDLFYEVLMHEVGHKSGSFKKEDLVHDMGSSTPGLFKFMIENPSSWVQLLPIYWDRRRKSIVYDLSYIVSWVLLFSMAYVTKLILGWVL